jgi:hypothetical protein
MLGYADEKESGILRSITVISYSECDVAMVWRTEPPIYPVPPVLECVSDQILEVSSVVFLQKDLGCH